MHTQNDKEKPKVIRLDFIFSYWIFLWYILYFFTIVKYSPKFILYVAMIDNVLLFSMLIYKKSSIYICWPFALPEKSSRYNQFVKRRVDMLHRIICDNNTYMLRNQLLRQA